MSLRRVRIGNNNFSGKVPDALWGLPHLHLLELNSDSLSGSVSNLISLAYNLSDLRISDNQFSGLIPDGIGSLNNLLEFHGGNNKLSGRIPDSMAKLIQLGTLDLSYNEMSSEIETLSFVLKDLGNVIAQGGESTGGMHGFSAWIFRSIFALARILFILGVAVFYVRYRNLRKKKRSLNVSKWRSFHKLGFDEFEIVKLMSEDNVIGSRSSGKVYKVVLSSGAAVAVKKLWRETKNGIRIVGSEIDEFDVEVETLGKIRHKNIVRLWSCYNNGDNRLLVYEYMPNGNLADMLKSNKKSLLDWPTRLLWLHRTRICIYSSVNEKSDIYSFGVVILELVTERPPNHADYGENDLVKWVSSLLEQKGMDHVIDPALDSTYKEEISKVLSVRFLCTNVLLINRPAMWWVVKMLRKQQRFPDPEA
ncbi:hypothetical protein AHAS_Ahas03G0138500 [Arachis hypogaea]